MNRVPAEIWSLIFLACPHTEATFQPLESPWTLGRVSRLWRTTVQSTPALWTSIFFPIDTTMGKHPTRDYAPMLRHALNLTNGHKLHIHISRPTQKTQLVSFQHLFDILLDRCESWVSFTVNMGSYDYPYYDPPILYPPKGREFSSLKRIDIAYLSNNAHARVTELLQALERTTPLLESISLYKVGKLIDQESVCLPDFPWSQMRQIELEDCYEDETKLLQVLHESSQHLETLFLHSFLTSAQYPQQVTLPRLRKIHLSGVKFCAYLSLPALQHMHLIKIHSNLDIVIEMMERSGCGHRLEYLSISDISMMEVTVERLLRLTPNIKELVLDGQVVSGYILERIAILLSELHSLTIRHGLDKFQSTLAPPPLNALVQLVKKAQNTRLRKVRLEAYEEVVLEKDVLKEVEMLSSPELVVDIRLDPARVDRSNRLLYLRDILYCKLFPLPADPVLMRNLIENMPVVDYLFRIWEDLEVAKASQSDAGATLARIIADIEIPREQEFHIRERAQRFYESCR